MGKPLHIISLGAGVQSTTMLLMALEGQLEPLPDAAIFADTQFEPAAVYRHLDWLEGRMAGLVPLYRVTAGNLRDDYLRSTQPDRDGGRFASIPVHIDKGDGARGIVPRQCTSDYKIAPIKRQVRALLDERGIPIKPGPDGAPPVVQWIGISLDEHHRRKPADVRYIRHRWPLVDLRMTRNDCLVWLERHGYPTPPKSSCIGCPFHSNAEWRAIKADPEAWADAVAFDAAIRTQIGLEGKAYLHHSRRPLPLVDLSTRQDKGQLELWDAECTGSCGV